MAGIWNLQKRPWQPNFGLIEIFGSQFWAPHVKQVSLKGMESLSKTAEKLYKKKPTGVEWPANYSTNLLPL